MPSMSLLTQNPRAAPEPRLYNDDRVEKGIARLYLLLSDAFVDGESVVTTPKGDHRSGGLF
jgi:hypothetical protein